MINRWCQREERNHEKRLRFSPYFHIERRHLIFPSDEMDGELCTSEFYCTYMITGSMIYDSTGARRLLVVGHKIRLPRVRSFLDY